MFRIPLFWDVTLSR